MAGAPPEQVHAALERVAKLVRSEGFQSKSKAFVKENCKKFEWTDENKLEYTDIYNKYQEDVESFLAESLDPQDLDLLLENLGGLGKTTDYKPTGEIGETLDILNGLGDFQSFKDMMLVARRDTEAAEEGTGATLASIASNACASADTSFNLPALDSMFAELATGVGQGGWEVQTNKGFFCHETKMVGQVLYNRMSGEMDLPPNLALDALRFDNPRMAEWMTMMEKNEIVKEYGPNDRSVKVTPKFSGAFRLITNFAYIHVRLIVKQDFPEKGSHSIGQIGWNPETESAEANKIFQVRLTRISPHPKDPEKSIIVIMEESKATWMPSWIRNSIFCRIGSTIFTTLGFKYRKCHELAVAEA